MLLEFNNAFRMQQRIVGRRRVEPISETQGINRKIEC